MWNRKRSPRFPAAQPRGSWKSLFARLSYAERVKRQLEKAYQRRAARRLRDSEWIRS